jgi:hydroxymethylbilane synthase
VRSQIIQSCNHPETEFRLRAERAYLRVLEGGCSIPVFALATLEGDVLTLRGGVIGLDGTQRIMLEVSGDKAQAEQLGEKLAAQVFEAGGKAILDDIRKAQSHK